MPIEISFDELNIWGISVVSEEGNWVCHYHRVFNWVRKPVLVADVWPQHKSRRNPCFWGTVSAVGLSLISVQTSFCGKSPHRLLCAAHLGGFTYWSGFFMCNRAFWGVFAEKFALGNAKLVVSVVVFAGSVEELPIVIVTSLIVFWKFHMKIRNPAQLAVDVSLNGQFRVVRHTRALHFILLVGV